MRGAVAMNSLKSVIKVKEWFIDKVQDSAKFYNCFIDYFEKTGLGTPFVDDNGFVFVVAEEILQETEKALKVKLATGDVVGSVKGWTTWIPKSVMSFND